MPYFFFNDYRVHYIAQGEPCGLPPMVLLHNAGNDSRLWSRQMDYFCRGRRVFALDLLGYGKSQRPSVDYSLPLYTEMLQSFIQTMGFEKVVLVGHCVGGATSLNFALTHPEKVARLVLFNVATVNTLLAGAYGLLFKIDRYGWGRTMLGRVVRLFHPPPWLNTLSIKQQYGRGYRESESYFFHLQELYRHPAQISTLYNLLQNFDSFAILDELVKPPDFPPTLVIWGQDNKILKVAAGKRLVERLKPDQFEILSHCGHMVMREKYSEVNALIDDFVTSQ